jgi:translation initiation factor IF-2
VPSGFLLWAQGKQTGMATNENDTRKTLNLSPGGTLELKKKVDLGRRSAPGVKTVTVEVKRRRGAGGDGLKPVFTPAENVAKPRTVTLSASAVSEDLQNLTASERATRLRVLQQAGSRDDSREDGDTELRVLRKGTVQDEEEFFASEAEARTDADVFAADADMLAEDSTADVADVAEPDATESLSADAAPAAPASTFVTTDQTQLRSVIRRPTLRTTPPVVPPAAATAAPITPVASVVVSPTAASAATQRTATTGAVTAGKTTAAPAVPGTVKPAVTAARPSLFRAEEPLRRVVRRFEEPIVVTPRPDPAAKPAATPARPGTTTTVRTITVADDDDAKRGGKKADPRKVEAPAKKSGDARRQRKLTITTALSTETEEERQRSLASVKRKRDKEKQRLLATLAAKQKIARDVVIPETLTVQDLANRMSEQTSAVVRELMKMGIMATATEVIDADTAELVVTEMGHTPKRVSEADVEIGLTGELDAAETLRSRPPVVTIMGHVDHGKTSLLDALRATDVAGREAGGITQHIGAYQVHLATGQAITFIDTPGHEAFTEMRSRGANVTDVVVLVVAADDSVMPQTIEAINHAKAANVPIIVAVNKIDKPGADPMKVKTELLSHGLVVEDLGGDIQCIEVSALKKLNLDQLEAAILVQAEILELQVNPDRMAEGAVIEARLDTGRGPVATVLVQRGTLRVGDIFVAGGEWGRVRALLDERGQRLTEATPSTPVAVLGLNGTPMAGDQFVVVENEARARDISDFRQRRTRQRTAAMPRSTMEQMFSQIGVGAAQQLAVVVKTDVHGSLEAIKASLENMSTDEVSVRVLHSGVGSITESDVSLAKTSCALLVGFNVRANPQARDASARDKVEIRYYSVIYTLIDDVRALASGLLAPNRQEVFLGYAQIRQVFNITKVGKVAGCYVTEGMIKRGCKVRLLRENVVIHEGTLKTLKRIKDEVREVKSGYECGMAFEGYQDIREGDMIECFEVEEVARTL